MNIFKKRPLFLILCIGLGGFFLFTIENLIVKALLVLLSVLPLILSFILRFDNKKKIFSGIISAALLVSMLLSFIYFDLWFKAYDIYDDEVEIVGTVKDKSATNSYTTRLLVKCESINGKHKNYKFYAYINKQDAANIVYGTKISFKATLSGFSDDSRSYNFSRGINAYANDIEDLKILDYSKGGIEGFLLRAKEYLTRYTIMMSDADTGAILSALLLGERDYLPDQLRLDFKRIGISHILALSGMHLAILSFGIDKLLSLLSVKKKKRIIITICFVIVYMALTGFSVSVVRAGIMLIISSILFLLSHERDSMTSLGIAVFLICLFNPNAIFDISLWLSALATLGIIVLVEIMPLISKQNKKMHKITRYIIMSLMTSIFAISATLIISTTAFGGFSILAPFTTLLFSILVEIIMYLGCVMMLIGWLIPLGFIVAPLCKLLSLLAGLFSSIEYSYISTNFLLSKAMIIIYTVVFYLFIVLCIKRKVAALNIVMVMFVITMATPAVFNVANDLNETVSYSSKSKSDEFIIRSRGEVCLINSAQYSKSLAYDSIEFLEDAKITHLDKYYLTHYSWSLDDDFDVLLSNVLVDEIYMPKPKNDDEITILKVLYKAIEGYRTKITLFDEGEAVAIGKYSIHLIHSAPYGITSANAFYFTNGKTKYTYISSGLMTGESALRMKEHISDSDVVVFGDHGQKYKSAVYLEEYYESIDYMVLHSQNLFLLQENMRLYEENGCKISSHPYDILYFK